MMVPAWVISFFAGVFVGCIIGVFLIAIVSAGRHDDEK
jgi:hypothetical protein